MPTSKKDVGAFLRGKGAVFRVWAPFAKNVEVTGTFNGWGRTPLNSEQDGYWAAEVENVVAGQEYKFVIQSENGEFFRNDPRSLQVTTNAGNSVIADPEFDWEQDGYQLPSFNTQVLYELHVGTFNRPDPAVSGTFASAAEKLDYLADLGITTIELMPIGSMPDDRGWGYATDYIYAVESLYGGRRELMKFVREAHKKGIGVILDVVYNHFGPGGGLDIWQFDGWSHDNKGGIYFYNDWRSATPWGDTRPDYGRTEVRQYITDNVRMWLSDCHIDGLRLDSTIYLRNVKGQNNDPDNDIPDGWSMLQDVTSVARKIKPGALLIAEDSSGNDYITKRREDGGAGFSAQWEVTFPHVLRGALNVVNDADRNLFAICDLLKQYYNGDAFQRIIYSDSHDSDANGAQRLSEEVSPGNAGSVFARKRSLLAAGIVLTAPGIPMLFQGQEFLQHGYFNDWQALDWERAEQFAGIVEAHKHLIALRKNIHGNAAGLIGHGFEILHCDDTNKVLAYHRWDKHGPNDDVVIVFNFSNQELEQYQFPLPNDGAWTMRFNSGWHGYSPDFKDGDGEMITAANKTGTVKIAPYSLLVLSQDK